MENEDKLLHSIKALKVWALLTKIAIPVGVVGAFALLAVFGINDMIGTGILAALISFVSAMVIFLVGRGKEKKLKSEMGDHIVLPALREVFEIKEYSPSKCLSPEWINSAGLIDDWTEIEGSDYFEGSYKGINIVFSDLRLQRKEEKWERNEDGKNEKKVSYITVFKGQWLTCDFGKELAASVRLNERKSVVKEGLSRYSNHDLSKSSIETEDVAFNKKYRIRAEDGHTAFYLLTPHFMEQLTATDAAADGATHFSFTGKKVHIALNNGRDAFEVNRMDITSMDSVRQHIRSDLKYLTNIMDILLKHDKLFKEEA
jgi:hypothetical protein